MIVRKSFQYSLRPTKKQERLLQTHLDECRWLHNELLAQRKLAHEELDLPLSKYQQNMLLPLLKEERTSLCEVHSQVLQNVVDRLDKAFQNFFRRCKEGATPGFPRFRGVHRYNSFCYPQSGFSLRGNELLLSKIGGIRIKLHRPIEGEIKTCTLKKEPSGGWTVSFSCLVEVSPLPPEEKAVGIDVGIETFATLLDGQTIPNPRFFKKAEKSLAKAQKKLSKLEKGSPERRKQGKVVAKIHEKVRHRRNDFCHKHSRKIVQQYQYICVEELDVKRMIEKTHLSKTIMDASWRRFLNVLTYKAEEAGRKIGFVNPAYTSQDCSQCGHRTAKQLSDRTHSCPSCGYRTTRDLNAAHNILALGLDGLGKTPRSLRL